MPINLVTVCGNNTPALGQMLNHYKEWVDNIFVNTHGWIDKESILHIERITKNLGCGIYKRHAGNFASGIEITKIYNATIAERPKDWWIVADSDELHVYPRSLKAIISECEQRDYRYVTGGFVDRIGENGCFPEIEEGANLWEVFPWAGFFRYPISQACPNKVVLLRGKIRLHAGQHYVDIEAEDFPKLRDYRKALHSRWRYPPQDCFVQVHHFKWDKTVTDRIHAFTQVKQKYSFFWEYEKMLNFICSNDYRIPFLETFWLQRCGNQFEDYKFWDQVKDICLKEDKFSQPLDPWKDFKFILHWLKIQFVLFRHGRLAS